LEEPGCCEVEPVTPEGGDVDVGDEVEVLVDSLDEEDEEELEDEEEDVVVDDDGPPLATGGLIAGTAPPLAGQLSVTTVIPPPSAERATRRSHRRGAPLPSLADPSLIYSCSPCGLRWPARAMTLGRSPSRGGPNQSGLKRR
jgi:hypothetical protein